MSEANISVRFSVTDAETVRAALEKLGTDGQTALNKLSAAGQAPSQGLKAVSSVVDDLKSRATGLAFSLGPVGTGLVALGPVGLAAGAALGLVIAGVSKLAEGADELGQKAVAIREFAESTGLTTDQVQALTEAGIKHGAAADQVAGAVQRFTQGWEQLRRGGGPLLDEINRINPALVDQIQRAGNAAAAWDIFSKAVGSADVAQRNLLLRGAGGRGGVTALGGAALDTNQAGGIDNLATSAKNAGDVLDQGFTKRLADLENQANAAGDTVRTKLYSMFAEPYLQHVRDTRLEFASLLDTIQRDWTPSAAWKRFMDWFDRYEQLSPAVPEIVVNKPAEPSYHVAAPDQVLRDQPAPQDKTAAATFTDMQKQMGILGPAATATEQLSLKQAELNALVEKAGGQYGNLKIRAMDYYTAQSEWSQVTQKASLGLFSLSDANKAAQDQMDVWIQQKLLDPKNPEQMAAGWAVLNARIVQFKATAAAATPEARALQDATFQQQTMFMSSSDQAAANAAKQIDPVNWQDHLKDPGPQMAAFNSQLTQARDLSVSFADNFAQAMAQGKTGAAALQTALQSLESSLIQIVSKNLVNQAFGGLLSAGGAGGSSIFGSLFGAYQVPTGTVPNGAPAGTAGSNVFGPIAPSGFALGGIMSSAGPIPLNRYARGGIASTPQVALFGEGSHKEAYVPLPDGRSIPVTVGGGGGGASQPTAPVLQVNHYVSNSSGAQVQTQEKQRPDGGLVLYTTVTDAVDKHVAGGGLDSAMRARYGMPIRPRSR